jgi:hypothetical protein
VQAAEVVFDLAVDIGVAHVALPEIHTPEYSHNPTLACQFRVGLPTGVATRHTRPDNCRKRGLSAR